MSSFVIIRRYCDRLLLENTLILIFRIIILLCATFVVGQNLYYYYIVYRFSIIIDYDRIVFR